ncbi:hypothetical protein FALBO_111 [Fusarium albosuccineum]|uniref:Uncharacterized protein n=1 Tax=Fusarium albosuccineum TaxID=1237068 RepID=A0A8H4PET2_9HYPO|nr:hypothetical protein FALBO_111 [Fusarium albosuccineum]
MSLEHLAPELLSLILQNVDSPRNLHHFISASPACLRTFLQSPQLVLSSVIKNALPAHIVQYALATLQAPSVSSDIPSFLDKCFDSTTSFDFPTNKADILQVYHLYNRLSYLLDAYLKHMERLGLGESVLLPSLSERTRLQRAFLRFELYCRVFPHQRRVPHEPPRSGRRFDALEQFGLFLSNLTPWEVEEMSCVELYLSSVIGRFVDQLEEQLISAIMAAPGVVVPSSAAAGALSAEEEEQPTEGQHNQENLEDFSDLDLTSLSLFSRDGRYRSPGFISYMTSLGLDFIYELVKSDESKRSEMIRSNHPITREFLPEALGHAPRWPPGYEHDTDTADDDAADDDDPSHSNLGYRLFRKRPDNDRIYVVIMAEGTYYSLLRQLGYVFWDANRIQSPEVFKKLSEAETIPQKDIRERFDRTNRETAEHRLKGVKLPREQMKRIEREFGIIRRGTWRP